MSASIHPIIPIAAMIATIIAALIATWRRLVERSRRQQEATDHAARLAAAFRALRECQAANDTLAAELRKRDAAIGRHLARENAAAVARVAAQQGRIVNCFLLGLPVHSVHPSQFHRN